MKGSAEIAGIPKGARRVFSKRRTAIEAELALHHLHRAAGGDEQRGRVVAEIVEARAFR